MTERGNTIDGVPAGKDGPAASCRSFSDLERHDHSHIRITGIYHVIDISPYKSGETMPDGRIVSSSRVAILELDDGTRIRLGIRSAEEMDTRAGTEVVIEGSIVLSPARLPHHVSQPDSKPTMTEITAVMSSADAPAH